jgi:hypothetical protein
MERNCGEPTAAQQTRHSNTAVAYHRTLDSRPNVPDDPDPNRPRRPARGRPARRGPGARPAGPALRRVHRRGRRQAPRRHEHRGRWRARAFGRGRSRRARRRTHRRPARPHLPAGPHRHARTPDRAEQPEVVRRGLPPQPGRLRAARRAVRAAHAHGRLHDGAQPRRRGQFDDRATQRGRRRPRARAARRSRPRAAMAIPRTAAAGKTVATRARGKA